MLFSIIVPVYNVADYLEKCVASILANDCTDSELLLVDDGSTDGKSGPLCDRLALANPLIRVLHKPNGGLGDARNAGIRVARGDYLIFIDSDDTVTPDYLSVLRQALHTAPADIYGIDFFFEREGSTELHDNAPGLPSLTPLTLRTQPALLHSLPSACAWICKRTLFTDSGIYYPARVWYEDLRTTFKLFTLAESIVVLHQPCYRYYYREDSITHNKNVARNHEIIEAVEDLLSFYRAAGLFETYREQLCALTVEHVFIAASVRVLHCDTKSPLLKELRLYTQTQFPDFRKSPRLAALPRRKRLIYRLLLGRHYRTVALLFRLKDRH